jgi:hypothetical protein
MKTSLTARIFAGARVIERSSERNGQVTKFLSAHSLRLGVMLKAAGLGLPAAGSAARAAPRRPPPSRALRCRASAERPRPLLLDDGVVLPAHPELLLGGLGGDDDALLPRGAAGVRAAGGARPSPNSNPGSAGEGSASYTEHKARTPPPDLPSLLLDSRIVYVGMPVRALPARRRGARRGGALVLR